ncbi:MAG TPA: NAD(P)H-binding protein [Ktedonobacterales bacterium]|nr:NAD(P)H-binding protein [Ktedonobacterales bacterium]
MKLTIFGATGGIGRNLLDQALAAGHDVTAVVRRPESLGATRARLVSADLLVAQPETLAAALTGADAVLSALGPRSTADANIASRGTRAILQAMRATGVRRIVAVSAGPVGTVPSPGRPHPPKHDPGDGFVVRSVLTPILKAALSKQYADLALMEDLLRDSGLDWTVIRPSQLINRSVTGVYRTASTRNIRRGLRIARADVADLMLRVITRPETIGYAMRIAY